MFRQKRSARSLMLTATALCIALLALSGIFYGITRAGVWFSLLLTFAAFSYHMVMRLAVGCALKAMHLRYDPASPWFREKPFEARFFKRIGISRRKSGTFTFDPEEFDMKKLPLSEIISNTCRAETVHEIIIVLGYLSLLLALFTEDPGANLWIFFITATFAALYDAQFVLLQRYNRPRLIRLSELQKQRAARKTA